MNRKDTRRRFVGLLLALVIFCAGAWYRLAYLTAQPESGVQSLKSSQSLEARNEESRGAGSSPLGGDLDAANPSSAEEDLRKLEEELRK